MAQKSSKILPWIQLPGIFIIPQICATNLWIGQHPGGSLYMIFIDINVDCKPILQQKKKIIGQLFKQIQTACSSPEASVFLSFFTSVRAAAPEKLQIHLHSPLDFSIPRQLATFCRNQGPPVGPFEIRKSGRR